MNIEVIHSAFHSQTADGGPDLAETLGPKDDILTIKLCAVDLVMREGAWRVLSLNLMRGFKQIQGRTIKEVRYHSILDGKSNVDGSIGTFEVHLEPKQ
jgi:hypothetical protein